MFQHRLDAFGLLAADQIVVGPGGPQTLPLPQKFVAVECGDGLCIGFAIFGTAVIEECGRNIFAAGRRLPADGQALGGILQMAFPAFVEFGLDVVGTVQAEQFAQPDVRDVAADALAVAVEAVIQAQSVQPAPLLPFIGHLLPKQFGGQFGLQGIERALHIAAFGQCLEIDTVAGTWVLQDDGLVAVAELVIGNFIGMVEAAVENLAGDGGIKRRTVGRRAVLRQ